MDSKGIRTVLVGLLDWIETRWPDSEAAKQAAAKSNQLAQRSEFIKDKSRITSGTKHENRRGIGDRITKNLPPTAQRGSPPDRKARFATYAIRRMESAEIKIERKAERIKKLQEVVEKGK